MAAALRTFTYRLLSYRCHTASLKVSVNSKRLFQGFHFGYPARPCACYCHSGIQADFVTRLYITDEDEFDRTRICSDLIGKEGENINKLKSDFESDVDVSVICGKQVAVSGNNIDKVKIVADRVSREIERIRDKRKTNFNSVIKEKVLTDDNTAVHNKICRLLFGRKGRKINMFVSTTGLDFEVTAAKEKYLYVSGTDKEVVNKAVQLLEQHVKGIRKFAGI